MDNLLKLQNTLDFEEFGYIDLVAITKKELDLELTCEIFIGVDQEPLELWQIICNGVREHKLILGEQYSNFELFSNHVLLWSYNQSISSLTFNKTNAVMDAFQVIGKLYERHIELVDRWIPFDSCFNKHFPLAKLIDMGHGKLAEGAESIIVGYQEVMNECGFKSSYISHRPKQWDKDQGWIDEDSNLKVLITERSYVVASKFTAKRIMN